MKHLDTGSDKIKKICDALRHETLEPAKAQAALILSQANEKATEILQEARAQAEHILENAKKNHLKEQLIFEASMAHAAKIFKEKLKLEIENHFLNPLLDQIGVGIFTHTELSAKVVSALLEGFKSKGLGGDLTAILSNKLDRDMFVKALAYQIKGMIAKTELSSLTQGVILKSEDSRVKIELNPEEFTKALLEALRGDFRKYFFHGA